MAYERHRAVLELATEGQSTVLSNLERIEKALRQVLSAGQGGNTQSLIPGLNPALLAQIEQLGRGQYSRVFERQIGVQQSLYRQEDVARKGALPIGSEHGFKGQRDYDDAVLAAAKAVSQSQRLLTQELDGILKVVQQELATETAISAEARRRLATETRVNQAYEQLQLRQLRERQQAENAIVTAQQRQAVAANKQAVADEQAANTSRISRNRADAIAAFNQLPAQGALSEEEINAVTSRPARRVTDTDLTYQRRINQADASSALAGAESKLLRAVEAAARGEADHAQLTERLRTSVLARDAAERRLTAATDSLAAAEQRAALAQVQGTRRSFRENFLTGFQGRGEVSVPYATQFGQAAKFSVLYGTAYKVLFGITQTLSATLQEGIAFQDAMTSLTIATGRPKEELGNLADTLGRAATDAGAAPSQGVEVGARSLGLYGATGSPAAEQDRVARISAEVVSRLAVGSGKQPVELQGDIAAIAQALNLGAAGQYRIADLDAFFTKKFGVAQGATLQTVAESGTLGKAAGFSDEALFAISAQIQSRTGQTDSAVAGFLSQIFSRGGEGSLTTVAQKYGVDPTQRLADVVADLAKFFQTATPQQRSEIAASFGRGRPQGAAAALLQGFPEIQKYIQEAAQGGDKGAAGAADRQFSQHMQNIGGQLALLGGDLKNFAQLLGESGLLDAVGLAVVVFDSLVEGVNGFLQVWNQLPNAIQDAILALGLLAVASRTGAGASVLSALRPGLGAAGVNRGLALAGLGRGVQGAEGALAASPAAAGGLRAAGAAAAASVGPWAIAIGGLLAIGSVKGSADRMRDAQDAAAEALTNSGLNYRSKPEDFEAQASELDAVARQNRDATGGFFNAITFGKANDANLETARRAEAAAAAYRQTAEALTRQAAAIPVDSSPFHDFSRTGLDTTFSNLASSGASANTQLDLLRDAINGLGSTSESAKAALTKFDPELFAGLAAPDVATLLGKGIKGFDASPFAPGTVGAGGKYGAPPQLFAPKASDIDEAAIQKRLQDAIKSQGITSVSQLDAATLDEIARAALGDFAADPPNANARQSEAFSALRERMLQEIKDRLAAQIKGEFGGILGTRLLNPTETVTLIEDAVKRGTDSLNSIPQADVKGRVGAARAALNDALQIQAHGSTDELTQGNVSELIAAARRQLVQSQIDEFEALRKVAIRNATTRRAAVAASRGLLGKEIAAVIRGGDADQLAAIIGAAGKGAANMARKVIEDAIAVARAAQRTLALMGQVAGALLGPAGTLLGIAGALQGSAEVDRLQGLLGVFKTTPSGTTDSEVSGFGGGGDVGGGGGASGPTGAQKAAAAASAAAVHNGGQIAAAKAAIQQARADMAAADKGSTEYYSALGSLYSAQQQLAEAIQANQHNLGLLRIDATNPLQVARLEAREAARKLAQDRRAGRGGDVLAQDRVDLQAAQANLEQTRFSQKLQQVQTADELGRISHTKYLSYLQHEHDRLEAIKHRTFQQQQQLDQVDQLMQDAAKQMQGQFNLGDIKLPTPYQVRRYVEQTSGTSAARAVASGAAGGTDARSYTFYVDDTNAAKITKIITSVVGRGANITTTATRRRP